MRRYYYLFLLVLLAMCAIVLVAILEPPIIADWPLMELIDNENLSLITSLINAMFTVFLLIFQGRDSEKKILMNYSLTESQWQPGKDKIFGLGKNHLVTDNITTENSNEHLIVIRDDRGSNFLWIPLEAKLITDVTCQTIVLSNIRIAYLDGKKWKKVIINQKPRNMKHTIRGVYPKESNVPIFILFILNTRQEYALQNNTFRISFRQKIYTADRIKACKNTSLVFHLSDNKLSLINQQ